MNVDKLCFRDDAIFRNLGQSFSGGSDWRNHVGMRFVDLFRWRENDAKSNGSQVTDQKLGDARSTKVLNYPLKIRVPSEVNRESIRVDERCRCRSQLAVPKEQVRDVDAAPNRFVVADQFVVRHASFR